LPAAIKDYAPARVFRPRGNLQFATAILISQHIIFTVLSVVAFAHLFHSFEACACVALGRLSHNITARVGPLEGTRRAIATGEGCREGRPVTARQLLFCNGFP
jgi:hypothetical protein